MNNKSYGNRLMTLEVRAGASLGELRMSKRDVLAFLQGRISDESMAAVKLAFLSPQRDASDAAFICLTDDELRRIAAMVE